MREKSTIRNNLVYTLFKQSRKYINKAHPRTRKAQLNVASGIALKGMGVLISLLLVPLTIDYLSKDTYGTWLTISSMATMLALFDIGIGNGLRNKLSEAISKQDIILARVLVSTAYLIFGLLQFSFILFFLLTFKYVPWKQLLNTNINNEQLQLVILVTAVAMATKLVLDILLYVLLAFQESSRVNLINFFTNALILMATYTLTCFSKGNLVYLAMVTAVIPMFVMLISGFILYRNRLKVYQPAFSLANFRYAKSMLSLSYKFFLIQMAVLIIFYTDNLIINQLFGPAEVTTYNICFRYFNVVNTLFGIIVTPYWSAFTEAFTINDVEWMKQTYRYMKKVWLGLVSITILMVLVAEPAYFFWVGKRVQVPFLLSACMGLFVVVSCWNTVSVTVINGLGKVKLQLYYAILSALMNIPLAFFFGKTLNMGSAGIILASIVSLLWGAIFGPIQANKLINGTASGIWDQ